MSFHIHYLKVFLVLFAIIFPSTLTGFFMSLQKSRIFVTASNAITYLFLVLLGLWTGFIGEIHFPNNPIWLFIAMGMGFVCICIEVLVGKFILYAKNRVWIKRIEIHESASGTCWPIDVFLILVGAFGEEMIFRQILFYIGMDILGWPVLFVVLFSSIIYGLNHIFFSRQSVVQKVFSGIVFSMLFLLSGKSIIIAVLAHFSQNLILYTVARSKRGEFVWKN